MPSAFLIISPFSFLKVILGFNSEFLDDDFQSVTDLDERPVASSKVSVKEEEQRKRILTINNAKNTQLYKKVITTFPDANLIDVNKKKEKD